MRKTANTNRAADIAIKAAIKAAERIEKKAEKRAQKLRARAERLQAAAAMPCGMIDNMDALRGLKQLLDNSATAVITDPPYAVKMASWDKVLPDPKIWAEALRVLKPGAYCVVAAAPRLAHRMAIMLEDAGFEIKDMLIWNYSQSFPGAYGIEGEWRSNLKTNHEPWIVARKPFEQGLNLTENWKKWGTGCVRTGAAGQDEAWKTNVISCKKPEDTERDLGVGYLPFPYVLPPVKKSGAWVNSSKHGNTHPTVKPASLMRAIVRAFCPDRGFVIDPFLGSGTTAMAAIAEGHDFAGFELDPGYWALASERAHLALFHPELVPAAA